MKTGMRMFVNNVIGAILLLGCVGYVIYYLLSMTEALAHVR